MSTPAYSGIFWRLPSMSAGQRSVGLDAWRAAAVASAGSGPGLQLRERLRPARHRCRRRGTALASRASARRGARSRARSGRATRAPPRAPLRRARGARVRVAFRNVWRRWVRVWAARWGFCFSRDADVHTFACLSDQLPIKRSAISGRSIAKAEHSSSQSILEEVVGDWELPLWCTLLSFWLHLLGSAPVWYLLH